MRNPKDPIIILMAEDDSDDRLLASEALTESRVNNDLHFVMDGIDMLEYLRREGRYANPHCSPRPNLILLDLNMPRMDGREALGELKSDPNFRWIPVVVLTTSKTEEDVLRSYELGAASYCTKPANFAQLVELMSSLGRYWVDSVKLP